MTFKINAYTHVDKIVGTFHLMKGKFSGHGNNLWNLN